jgi:nickel-type superoxide dismutase maturation protease
MSQIARLIPIFEVTVIGPSMQPALKNGQKCIAVKGHFLARPGAIAVFTHPARPELVQLKRLVHKTNGKWWVIGDNESESTDSRDFGAIDPALIRGIVIKK